MSVDLSGGEAALRELARVAVGDAWPTRGRPAGTVTVDLTPNGWGTVPFFTSTAIVSAILAGCRWGPGGLTSELLPLTSGLTFTQKAVTAEFVRIDGVTDAEIEDEAARVRAIIQRHFSGFVRG